MTASIEGGKTGEEKKRKSWEAIELMSFVARFENVFPRDDDDGGGQRFVWGFFPYLYATLARKKGIFQNFVLSSRDVLEFYFREG